MRLIALLPAILLAACGPSGGNEDQADPELSQLYQKTDASFSGLPINTQLSDVEPPLPELVVGQCAEWGECDWQDEGGVRHYFFDEHLFMKLVAARDVEGQAISALGIGLERGREAVLAAASTFLDGDEFRCVSGDTIETCEAILNPGWVQIDFDADGNLVRVKFDGYNAI